MVIINRRRAPSSQISSEKKLSGHTREHKLASLINAFVIPGTQKADIKKKKSIYFR